MILLSKGWVRVIIPVSLDTNLLTLVVKGNTLQIATMSSAKKYELPFKVSILLTCGRCSMTDI